MDHVLYSVLVSVFLFVGVFVAWELGRRHIRLRLSSGTAGVGISAVEGSVFGLMGLMLAFSFSGALQRWDWRRTLVVEETNYIGTAWLRLELLPADARPELRELFRRYLDSRLATYRVLPDFEAARREMQVSTALQLDIWERAVALCSTPEGERARVLLLPALNDMIDSATARIAATKIHPPTIINVVLIGLVLASSLMAGSAMASDESRSWAHMLCFAFAMAVSVYLIFDLEYPRMGLIRIEDMDELLIDLRASMN